MDRLERLINLVAALLETERPLPRAEVRERVGGYSDAPEAFRRNFERDKDLLRQMGLPVMTEPLDPDHPDEVGYRIPRDRYELPDLGLADDELAALRLAVSAVQVEGAGGSEATISALRKLAGGSPAGTSSAAGEDGPASSPLALGALAGVGTAAGAGDAAVAVAFGVVAERRRVRFGYRGQARRVDPWRLSFRKGLWYLAGWDHARQEERTYRLDRVEGEIAPDGPAHAFERPEQGARPAPQPWRLGDEPEVLVDVLVDASHASFATQELAEDAVVERRPDGAVVARLAVTNRDALRSWVLGFLDHAEVLGPPEVRADLVAWLDALVAS